MQKYTTLMQTLLSEFASRMAQHEPGVLRDCQFKNIPNKIEVAIGMRRTGKTHFLFQTIQELLSKKIKLNQILYINFEDERILPMNAKECGQFLDTFYSLYPENHERITYLFLDEIQNIEEWPLVIRRFYDSKKVKIYLSGSSAKLLSKEIATSLRGRSVTTEIWPFSFQEYLSGQQITLPPSLQGQKEHDTYLKHLHNYLTIGGFPEVQNLNPEDRRAILQNYVDTVIFRDIIERHNIHNTPLIKYLAKFSLQNFACTISTSKLLNDLKSQGITASKNTIYEYLEHIEDAFLAFRVPIYSESYRKTQTNPKKNYAIDTGLAKAYSTSHLNNLGRYFENLFYIDLRRQGYKIFYYKTADNYEIDFLTESPTGQHHLWQIVWDLDNSETYAREKRALETAEKETGIKGELIDPIKYLQELSL